MEVSTTLYICKSNVGRSQIAEAYHKFYQGGNVLSGGVEDVAIKYNYVPHPSIVDVMREVGIDISRQRVKLVTPEMVDEADYIVALCKQERLPDYVLRHRSIHYWNIQDPYPNNLGLEALREIRDEIRLAVYSFISGMMAL